MKKSCCFLFVVLALLLPRLCPSIDNPRNSLIPHLTQGNLFSPSIVPTVALIHDSTDLYWTIFSSDFFGFHEFWLAYSTDAQNWSRPLYTGIPVLPSSNYQIRVNKHQIDFDWRDKLEQPPKKIYYRSFIDTTHSAYTILKRTLYEDTDADGLSDLAEEILWTDPFEIDTDGDDKADGYDLNPLAAPADSLSPFEKLHKAIIEYELEEFYSNQLVIVEQFNNKAMEYDRYDGIVLSFSSGGCDAFVNDTGYGVPILTCTVKDTLKQQFKANFQFFIAPDDAWGYDVLCRWSDVENDFVNFVILNEWVAQ